MGTREYYKMPELPFALNALEPFMSEAQLTLHYEKHHSAYVKAANAILEKIEKARKENADLDMKAELKSLSFNVAGHHLHSLFWENLHPHGKEDGAPFGEIAILLDEEFGGFERFKKEFNQAAVSVEGSGWAVLVCDAITGRLMIMQIEKHNVNVFPSAVALLVVDVFEHSYYLDCKNDRAAYLERFWKLVNWEAVNKRVEDLAKK